MASAVAAASRAGRPTRAFGAVALALLVAILAVAFAAVGAPRAAAQGDAATGVATLTIHNRICPAGFEGPDYYGACHDNPAPLGLLFYAEGPQSRQAINDAPGNNAFLDLTPGTYTVYGGPPGDFTDVNVFCSPGGEGGTPYPFEYVGGGYQISLSLAAGTTVVCDWYNTPIPQGPTTANLTIRGQLCPAGYTGTDYFNACKANVPAGTEYSITGPSGTTGPAPNPVSTTFSANAAGLVDFAGLAPGSYVVRGGVPGEFAKLAVYCTAAAPPYQAVPFTALGGGTRGPNDVTGVEINLGPGANVVCSFYNIPESQAGPSPTPKPSASAHPSASPRPSASAAPVVSTLPRTGAGPRLEGADAATLLLVLTTGVLMVAGLGFAARRRTT